MASRRLLNSSSVRKQSLLTEFAGLETACPTGVFMCLTPGDPTLWSGIIFVRKGPYFPSILRFQISFPAEYPFLPPLVTFSSDIFHPLLTPLSTLTYTTDIQESGTVSATDLERLPPGGFSLRHGFPSWYNRSKSPTGQLERIPIYEVLDYIRSTFDDDKALDAIPIEAAGNTGAWHAWKSYRAKTQGFTGDDDTAKCQNEAPALPSPARLPGEWNWDGVWEVRAKRGIDLSTTDSILYGSTTLDNDLIKFLDRDESGMLEIQENLRKSLEVH